MRCSKEWQLKGALKVCLTRPKNSFFEHFLLFLKILNTIQSKDEENIIMDRKLRLIYIC
jgi:hypothetical protein